MAGGRQSATRLLALANSLTRTGTTPAARHQTTHGTQVRRKRPLLVGVLLVVIGLLNIPIAAAASPPANDDFADATVINELPFSDAVSTAEATEEPEDSLPGCIFSNSVWYAFTPTTNTKVIASAEASDYEVVLGVFTGTRDALTPVHPACFMARYAMSLTADTTYYFVASRTNDIDLGNLVFDLRIADSPPNDDFENATQVTQLPFSDSISTSEATVAADEPFDPGCGGSLASVWYAFTPDDSIGLRVSTRESSYNTIISVWTGSQDSRVLLGCQSNWADENGEHKAELILTAKAGTAHYFRITCGTQCSGGDLMLDVSAIPPPSNDDITNAIVIDPPPFPDPLSFSDHRFVAGATPGLEDPQCTTGNASFWYSFAPTSSMQLAVTQSTFDTGFTVVGVYEASHDALTEVTCSQGQPWPPLSFFAEAGKTYYILISALDPVHFPGGVNSDFTLEGVVALDIEVNIAAFGAVNRRTGTATVAGTVSCNVTSEFSFTGNIMQQQGQAAYGFFVGEPQLCEPPGVAWSVVVPGEGGRFVPGNATVHIDVGGNGSGGATTDVDTADRTIRLR
jgi:hypothetical protein